eukprot:7376563-Prymnesium_polylepis.2
MWLPIGVHAAHAPERFAHADPRVRRPAPIGGAVSSPLAEIETPHVLAASDEGHLRLALARKRDAPRVLKCAFLHSRQHGALRDAFEPRRDVQPDALEPVPHVGDDELLCRGQQREKPGIVELSRVASAADRPRVAKPQR